MVVLAIVCAVLAVGCLAADKLLPRIGAVERLVRRLPLGKEDQVK